MINPNSKYGQSVLNCRGHAKFINYKLHALSFLAPISMITKRGELMVRRHCLGWRRRVSPNYGTNSWRWARLIWVSDVLNEWQFKTLQADTSCKCNVSVVTFTFITASMYWWSNWSSIRCRILSCIWSGLPAEERVFRNLQFSRFVHSLNSLWSDLTFWHPFSYKITMKRQRNCLNIWMSASIPRVW